MTRVRRLTLPSCTAVLAACMALAACGSMTPRACPPGQQAAIQELLYFGTDKPSGRVTPDDWGRFLRDTVTPRFPQGLTAWQASGQWRSAAGTVVHEPSYVLSLVRPPGDTAEQAIGALVADYKARFEQEAVLRVASPACMSL